MTLRVGLTHPALAQLKLTFMDYLLTMLRNLLRRKLSCDSFGSRYGRHAPFSLETAAAEANATEAKGYVRGVTKDHFFG